MNFPFVPPASNAATLRWKNWIAIHFLITGVAVLTLSGFSSVMGIWVLEDYGLTLSAPGWELMRGAKVHIIIQDAKDGIRNDKFLKSGGGDSVGTRPRPFHYWYLDGKTTDKAWTLALMPSRALARGHGSRAGV